MIHLLSITDSILPRRRSESGDENTEIPAMDDGDDNIIIFATLGAGCGACLLFGIIVGVVLARKKSGPQSNIEIPMPPVSEGKGISYWDCENL